MTKIEQMQEHFSNKFMNPECYIGADIELEIMEAGLDCESDKYYCRLSASGFLDCTEWFGPFDSVEDCAEFLMTEFD